MKFKVLIGVLVLLSVGWFSRFWVIRFIPIEYSGTVLRIASFNKGGWSSASEKTHQLNQFAIIFEDGFNCEGSDTSFAAIKEGDLIEIRGYYDVHGFPLLNPEWGECDEAQLIRIQTPKK